MASKAKIQPQFNIELGLYFCETFFIYSRS
jgi:hypothetical protein